MGYRYFLVIAVDTFVKLPFCIEKSSSLNGRKKNLNNWHFHSDLEEQIYAQAAVKNCNNVSSVCIRERLCVCMCVCVCVCVCVRIAGRTVCVALTWPIN
jgi:hypothetical protein